MPKRPDVVETTLLALEILRRIPRNRKISAVELHAELVAAGFDRDIRTIQRQLELLSQHFDIERDDRNRPYGYRWKEQAKALAVPMLTEQESLLLTLAEQHLRNLLPTKLMRSMEGCFVQARTKLGTQGADKRAREWLTKVRVVSETQPLLPPAIADGVFEAVSNALYNNLWLAVRYKNAGGRITVSDIMPLGLAQQGPRLYLVCRFKGFDNERSLALHRVLSAEPSTLCFERPKGFDLKRYDDDGRFGMSDGTLIRLSFRITKDAGTHLIESPLSKDQQVIAAGEFFDISATVIDTRQLGWWLQSFGDQVSNVRRGPISIGVDFSL